MSNTGQTVNERINSTHYNSYHQEYSRISYEPGSDDVGPKQKNVDCTNGGCNSWAQVLNNGPNQNSGSGSQKENSTIKGEHDATTKSALLSDNWGHTVINQDKAWDLPPSPQSSPKESTSVWRSNPTNGTEIWENTVRHNRSKGSIPNNSTNSSISQSLGHKPTNHIGGTWGEDEEDAINVWTGVPSSNGTNNNHTANSINNLNNNSNKSNWTTDNANNGSDNKQWDSQNCHKPYSSFSSSWGEAGSSKNFDRPFKSQDNGTSHWETKTRTVSENEKPESTIGTWSPSSKKEAHPSGWEDDPSGNDKRNIDDGTAVWGNPTRQSKVSHWNETQNAKTLTNYANNNNNNNNNNAPSQTGTNSGISPGPGMIRLPPGAPVSSSKPNEVWNKVQTPQITGRVWNENSNRDPSLNQANFWGDNDQNKSIPGTPRTALGVWNDASSRESSNQWDSDVNEQIKNIPIVPNTPSGNLGSGWNDSFMVNKPKTPTERSNWNDNHVDVSNWAAPKQKTLTKEMIWASRQFRTLSEMGFKKEDIENVLRSRNLNFEEALAELRLFSANNSNNNNNNNNNNNTNNDIDLRTKQSTGISSNTPSLLTTQGLNNNYPGLPSINSRSTSMFSQLMPQPNYQQQSQQQQQQQTSPANISHQQQQQQQNQTQLQQPIVNPNSQNFALVNQVQNALRNSNSRGCTTTPNNLPSEKQVLQLVQQIKLAVQSGHLNAQMLNQPLAPTNIHLIYHLLQQIWTLQQLQAQISSPAKSHDGLNNLHVQITLTKQRITNLQNHIAAQQATFLKQQQPQQTQTQSQTISTNIGNNGGNNIHSMHGNNILKISELESSLNNISSDLRDMNINTNQSRLKTWKLSNFEEGDFSRAVGTNKQMNNMTPGLSRSDSASWSVNTSNDDNNWTDSIVSPSCNINQVNDMIQNSNISMQSQAQNAYDLNDLVPEFVPGKPWKVNLQMKSIEDDPHMTPASANRLFSNWPKISTCSTDSSPTLSLSSSTWAFTPNNINIPVFNDVGPKTPNLKTSGWGSITTDTPTDSLWNGSSNKNRGPPPGLSQVKSQTSVSGNNLWNSDSRNSQWDRQQNGSGYLLLRNLTPQIDGSTLKTLCMQHGPLQLFHLFLNHGIALVRYSTKEEAAKAQSALNNCVLGNTTILSEIPSDSEVQQYINLGTAGQQMNNNHLNWTLSANNSNPVQNNNNNNNNNTSNADFRNTSASLTYGNSGVTTSNASNTNTWSGLWSYSSSSNNLWGAPSLNSHESSAPSSLQGLLPGDLLGGEST